MVLKFKVYQDEAMAVMSTLANNGYKPVMSLTSRDGKVCVYPDYVIAIDTNDVINEEKDYCDLKLDYLKKPCTPECPDFKRCWGDEEEDNEYQYQKTEDYTDMDTAEFMKFIMDSILDSDKKDKSRILNE